MSAKPDHFRAFTGPVSRRGFLRSTVGIALGVAIPRQLLAQCNLTTPDILGPFYANNPPTRTILASADEPGARLFISGKVTGVTCTGGIEGAIVDVWHATDAGCYSVHQPCPDEDPMNCRGQMLTDADGNYAFETVLPGPYLNGATFRPRHIHYTISAPGGPSVSTQLYFEGDPYIATDPWASSPSAAERIIPLQPSGGSLIGEWDVHLNKVVVGLPDQTPDPTRVFLYQNFPNPVAGQTTIRYQLHRETDVQLDVIGVDGRHVRRLVDQAKPAGYHTTTWDGRDDRGRRVTRGTYLYRMVAGDEIQARKMLLRGSP